MSKKLLKRLYLPGALVYVFLFTWQLMRIFEPTASITPLNQFWSYFLVTSIAPGLTGYVPTTMWGKLTAELIYICGAAALTAIAAKIIFAAKEIETKKLKGLSTMKCSNHIVVLGHRPGETEAIITEILVGNPHAEIVLCSMRIQENPMPDKISFVYGDNTADETLDRAGIARAAKILIYGHTDDRTIAIVIGANSRANKDAHIVVHLESEAGLITIKRLNPKIECITSFRKTMLAKAVNNPGSTRVVMDLISHNEPNSQHRLCIPEGVPMVRYGDFFVWFKKTYDAVAIAVMPDHNPDSPCMLNPSSDALIGGGMSLFFIATRPLNDVVDWKALPVSRS